jgi:hypothetical protein
VRTGALEVASRDVILRYDGKKWTARKYSGATVLPNFDAGQNPTGPYAIVSNNKGYEIAVYAAVPAYAAEKPMEVKVTAEGVVEVVAEER